jgi:alpha-L-rhamnosidase
MPLSILPVLLAVSSAGAGDSLAIVEQLRCEYRIDPLGIDVAEPRLFWQIRDARRGARHTAYQVLVASTPEKLAAHEGDLWDSGRVESNQSTQVVYAGKPLRSRLRCYWKVRIWDADGKPTAYSKPALWTMGLLKPEDVKARWIGLDRLMTYPEPQPGQRKPLSFDGCSWLGLQEGEKGAGSEKSEKWYFRGTVTIPAGKVFRRTQLLTAAGGDYEVFVNGKPTARHGADNTRRAPQVLDIAWFLVPGKNVIGVAVTGDGSTPPALMGKLVVDFDDHPQIVSPFDDKWKVSSVADKNWNAADFDDSHWSAAAKIGAPGDRPWGPIVVPGANDPPLACPLLRKEFQVRGPVRRATLYGSALGLYRFFINGRPVGDDYFAPGWTDYKKRVHYQTYDVTDLVHADGTNAIGAILAGGWYYGAPNWFTYGDRPQLLAQLELEMADGSVETVATDGTWTAAFGPYVEAGILAGETYDATREIAGWSSPGVAAGDWHAVQVADSISAKLEAAPDDPVVETGRLETKAITEPKPGVFVFDLGQNFAGVARLKVSGPRGTRVTLRFAEMLNPDGTIYTANLGGAWATDTYVLRGEGEETWQPQFTFHGFRYVELTGYPGRPPADAIIGIVLNSRLTMSGSFECSNPMVNRLYQNTLWTQRANFISIPTDCPQRDERLGWTGDVETFIRAATYNADVAAFFTKWLVDLDDAQGPEGDFPDVAPRVAFGGGTAAWADVGTVCPMTLLTVYNDRRLLARQYPGMVRWVEYCRRHSKDLLRPAAGYGDWLSIKADTPKDVLATAWFAQSTRLVADAARTLGKADDARRYDELFHEIKAAFNKAYVAADGRIHGNTQTCYVLGLAFDLLPPQKRAAAARYLVEDIRSRDTHLSTGFIGTSLLMPVLSNIGQTPLAYKLLLNETFPSWGFSIRHGATTTWERWDGWTPEHGFQDYRMNSFAHYSFGAVVRWMFQTVAGIDTAEPGFQRLSIRPEPAEGLTWVKARYDSIHGPIAVHWRVEHGKLMVDVTIPANTTAVVSLPVNNPADVTEGGRPAVEAEGVKTLPVEGGRARFEVGAGHYQFAVPWKP